MVAALDRYHCILGDLLTWLRSLRIANKNMPRHHQRLRARLALREASNNNQLVQTGFLKCHAERR
jgi:hypothetical protein